MKQEIVKEFEDKEINGLALLLLDEEKLAELGVVSLGSKTTLLSSIAKWKEEIPKDEKEEKHCSECDPEELCLWLASKCVSEKTIEIVRSEGVGGDFLADPDMLSSLGLPLGPLLIIQHALSM